MGRDWEFDYKTVEKEDTCFAYVSGFQYYEFKGDNKCRMTFFAHIDPNAPSIPDMVVNFATKRVLYVG